MDEQRTEQPEAQNVPEMSVYEQLYRCLYDYHFGRIKFLELLDKWEEILHLPSSPQRQHYLQQENL